MSQVAIAFTAKEIIQQICQDLILFSADTKTIPLEKWLTYIIARAVEDVMLIDLDPPYDPRMEPIATLVRSNYRRIEGEETYTLQEDVGSNKLFPYLGSADLSFESRLELHRYRVLLAPR
jgi:hypothetical protein